MVGIDFHSQLIIGLAKSIDDRLHNRFMGRYFENLRTWALGREIDVGRHCIRDMDHNLSTIDVVLYRRHCDICANYFLF